MSQYERPSSALLLAGAASVNWEWQNATQRAVLAESSYRSLEVKPGNQTVDEGAGSQIDVSLIGRTNREVVLWTRSAEQADAEWTERTLEEQSGGSSAALTAEALTSSSRPRAVFVAKFDRLMKGIEYRVTAGELASPVYRIDIRRPLRMDEIKIELTPPSYTGQAVSVSLDPNLSVLQGTVGQFEITFDKPVKSAAIVLAPRKKPRDDEDKNEPEVVPLDVGRALLPVSEGSTGKSAHPTNLYTTLTLPHTLSLLSIFLFLGRLQLDLVRLDKWTCITSALDVIRNIREAFRSSPLLHGLSQFDKIAHVQVQSKSTLYSAQFTIHNSQFMRNYKTRNERKF